MWDWKGGDWKGDYSELNLLPLTGHTARYHAESMVGFAIQAAWMFEFEDALRMEAIMKLHSEAGEIEKFLASQLAP